MSKGQSILGVVIVAGFIALTGMLIFSRLVPEIPDWARENIALITGAWISNFTIVVSWFFGSSKGSSDKSQIMRTMKPIKPEECIEPIMEGGV